MAEPTTDGNLSLNELKRGQDRIESMVSGLATTVNQMKDSLGQLYMPRPELGGLFSAIRDHQQQQDGRLGDLESGRQVDRQVLESRVQLVEERHRADRFNTKMFALTTIGLLITLATIVIAHWK